MTRVIWTSGQSATLTQAQEFETLTDACGFSKWLEQHELFLRYFTIRGEGFARTFTPNDAGGFS